MSLRSTMDLGLSALTAPSESSGSAAGVLAAVGAAVASLAAVTAVQKAVAEQIKELPALGLSEQSMGDVADLNRLRRPRSSGELLPVGFQYARDRAARRVVEAMARKGLVKPDSEAARAMRWQWSETLETPDGVAVLTDTLLDLGDPMGDALALTAGKQPFVNMGVEDEWSDPLNTELSPSDSIQDPMTEEEEGWHETRCTLENPMKIGDRPGGSLGMEWYAPLSNAPNAVPVGPEVAAMFDRYGYDGDYIVETYGGKRFRDFVDDDYDGYCRDHFCLYPNVSNAARFEVHVCSKGPLPKKGA